MKFVATIGATLLIASSAMAESADTGTIVWDTGIFVDERRSNDRVNEVIMEFTSVNRTDDGQVLLGDDSYKRTHLFGVRRQATATFRKLDLPVGEYVLSSVSFREKYQQFCLLEKTLMFTVEPGETQYLGQFIMNEPSTSPTLDKATFIPIRGMSRSLEFAQDSYRWRFGDASLANLEAISLSENGENCSSGAPVKGWD